MMKISVLASTLAGFTAVAQPVSATAGCDPISKYSTKWFLENTKPEWRFTSFDSTALFYTQGLSQRARQFARQATNNKITIWEVWPCENYFIKMTRQNPLYCIMSDFEQEMIYFENMSRAFAMKASRLASVMHRDIENPPMSSIWGRVELPVLQADNNPWGTVDYITAIDAEDVQRRKLEWVRYFSANLYENADSILQKILHGRDEQVPSSLGKRVEGEACPMITIDDNHPLW